MKNNQRKQVNYSLVPVFNTYSKSGFPEFKVYETEINGKPEEIILIVRNAAYFQDMQNYN